MGPQVELNLGHFCNNRCVFCVSGQLTEFGQAGHFPLAVLTGQLDAAKARGARTITLLGGEPTLHADFLPLIDHAVGLGFDEIVLFTNGARAGDREFLEDVCRRGRFTWRFSIQGGTREAHDATVQRKGAWDRIVSGLRTLAELGQTTTVNLCVNGWNHRSLAALPATLGPLGVQSFHADMVRPHSVGLRSDDEMDALIAPYSEVAANLRAMLAAFAAEAPAIQVQIGNLPFCVLPDHAERITHGGELTETVTGIERGLVHHTNTDKYAYQADRRQYAPACDRCALKARCVGMPDAYVKRYGLDEVEPIRDAGIAKPRTIAPVPGPRAHLNGTLRLLDRVRGIVGETPYDTAVRALVDRPAALPERGDGLKYDVYLARGPRDAWGLTVNGRWEPAFPEEIARFAGAVGGGYALDRVAALWERPGVVTLGVGFDKPGAPPRLKVYLQEDAWGTGVLDADEAADIAGVALPAWIRRVDVLCANLRADGSVDWKVYVGGPSPAKAARGAPDEVQALARRMASFSPLGPGWYYVTARLGEPVRYAMNKIYDPGRSSGSAPWRDVAALFESAGRSDAMATLLREVAALKGVRVAPTATAVEDGGRSVDVYCAAWAS